MGQDMSVRNATESKTSSGSVNKRKAILDGALKIFSSDGYSRASIDSIAAEAAVSTRTIYNHFKDKAALFQAVIKESASEVAESQIATMDRHFYKITDLEADLINYGLALSNQKSDYPDHFALVRQINAEIGHIPPAAMEAWHDAGPRRVRTAFIRHIQQLADSGWLEVLDAERASSHFILLVATEITNLTQFGTIPIEKSEELRIVTSGVQAFLRAYPAK